MFERITPEEAGISSDSIRRFISILEKRGAATHSILMMRHGKILTEHYWAPFHKDFLHRMYSQTKSFVAIAIGLLEEEGKLSLDDRIADHFPEKTERELPRYLAEQTVKEMLTMTTAGACGNWFKSGNPDRVNYYMNSNSAHRPAGTVWEYDSAGSQVMSALVEKLSGMPLLDYLKVKLFNKMGTFKTAQMLKTPNGDTWGDSAMLCTARDIASFGQLCMNYGLWEGERLVNESFMRTATSRVVDNNTDAHGGVFQHGYGYQIWRTEQNGFAFVGMGHQFTVCLPDRDFIFVCTSDNQGERGEILREIMISCLFDIVVDGMQDTPLEKDEAAEARLAEATSNLKLRAIHGDEDSPFRAELSGRTYICGDNPMGIKEFSFHFDSESTGKFRYVNAQGEKVIPFGVNHNVFGKFPELGYSDGRGGVRSEGGFMYNDAVSFAWLEEKKLMLFVQIIDRYFGNMGAIFAFKGDEAVARFTKCAEDFLDTYCGELVARRA